MFRGEFVHSIDSKGRVSIPTPFREELQRRSDQPPMLTRWSKCLQLYTYEDWCDREAQFMALPNIDPNVEKLRRLIVSGANPSKIDAQGRLLIPPLLRAHADIEREVTIAGVGTHIEIWNKAHFDDDIVDTQDRYYEISSSVSNLVK